MKKIVTLFVYLQLLPSSWNNLIELFR